MKKKFYYYVVAMIFLKEPNKKYVLRNHTLSLIQNENQKDEDFFPKIPEEIIHEVKQRYLAEMEKQSFAFSETDIISVDVRIDRLN